MSTQPALPLNRYIDHTLLKADATHAAILKVCQEALTHHFASVCVNAGWAGLAAETLAGSDVATCVVVGFPLGATLAAAKAYEAGQAIAAGAREIDMVMNIGAAKSGLWDWVRDDIAAVLAACRSSSDAGERALLKVIFENCLLTDAEKTRACEICRELGVDFVKTSTGFSTSGATIADVRLMRQVVGPAIGVKAAGGVRTKADALAMIEAGATRIGTSGGVAILADTSVAPGIY